MAEFGGLLGARFEPDDRGRVIFYPWGANGKGFILSGLQKKEEIHRFIKFHFIASLLFFVLVISTLRGFYAVALFPLAYFWYWYRMNRLLDGLETARERLGVGEAYIATARSYDIRVLWFFEVVSSLSRDNQ